MNQKIKAFSEKTQDFKYKINKMLFFFLWTRSMISIKGKYKEYQTKLKVHLQNKKEDKYI